MKLTISAVVDLPDPLFVTEHEGGSWVPFGEHKFNTVHSIRFRGGIEWDCKNGWRPRVKDGEPPEVKDTASLDDLEIGTRARNVLAFANIKTVEDLESVTARRLWREPNMGRVTIAEIESAMKRVGRHLANE